MKLILKTTTGRTTDAEFASGTTIRQVKESLQDEYDLASLRLCFQGKILADDSTIDTLTEGAALFIAGKKASIKKPETIAPASAPTASTTSTSSTTTTTTTTNASATASTAEPTTTTATATNPEATTTNTTTSATNTTTANTTTTPETTQDAAASAAPVPAPTPAPEAPTPAPAPAAPLVDRELVDGICAMGFDDRPLVELALRAAYMNPDRAVDYLCSGTPRSTLQRLADDASPAIARPVPAPTAVPRQAPPATAAPAPANTALQAALASIPNFDQIKEVVRQNPASLPTFMQQLQQNHPEVFALVQENPQAFLDLLQSNASPAAEGVSTPTTVELTAQDQIAIQELAEIGGGQWDLQAAAIVYIAVNKNKEVAAAVLFEHGGLPPQLMQALLDRQAGGSGGDDDFEDDGDFEDN